MKKICALLILVVAAIVSPGCSKKQDVSVPTTDRRLSVSQEIKIGRRLAPAFENAVNGLCGDKKLQEYVNEVGNRIVSAIPAWHPREYEFSFAVVNSRLVNACVLPGGRIYVTRGLLEKLDSEDHLAAVLAHQVAHVTLRHCTARSVAALEQACLFTRLSFTSGQEARAGEIGVFYLSRTERYNPFAMILAMGVLDAQDPWRENHPDEERTAEDIAGLIRERYPEFSDSRAAYGKLPDCVLRLQRVAPVYYATFEDGEKLRLEALGISNGGDAASKIKLALVYFNNAVEAADEARDLPAIFLVRRGQAFAGLAEITKDERHIKAARADFDRAKRIDENCYLARLYRGKYFLEADGFYGPAEEELKIATGLNPGGADCGLPYYYTAKLFDAPANPCRNRCKAVENYEKYLSLEPEGPHAEKARERIKDR